jgi:hypothetical protein
MYHKIYDFCRVRNQGNAWQNGEAAPPRVQFIIELLNELGIQWQLDRWWVERGSRSGGWFYNLYLPGDGTRAVVAHHDIVRPDLDNANDNSASVICAIALKMLMPEIQVWLLDGEEVGGIGSQRCAESILQGEAGNVEWVLNLELSGSGGQRFFVGNYPGQLQTRILQKFGCPIVETPFNDAVIFRRNGIDSCVINPLPGIPLDQVGAGQVVEYLGEALDLEILYRCHTPADSVDRISPVEMQEYVEKVLVPICGEEI